MRIWTAILLLLRQAEVKPSSGREYACKVWLDRANENLRHSVSLSGVLAVSYLSEINLEIWGSTDGWASTERLTNGLSLLVF